MLKLEPNYKLRTYEADFALFLTLTKTSMKLHDCEAIEIERVEEV